MDRGANLPNALHLSLFAQNTSAPPVFCSTVFVCVSYTFFFFEVITSTTTTSTFLNRLDLFIGFQKCSSLHFS